MLESQWRDKRDDDVELALADLASYTSEAQRVILAESERRGLRDKVSEVSEAGPAVVEPVQSGLSHRFERFIGGLFTLCLIITVPLAIWNISTIPHGGEIPLLVGWFIGYCAAISGIPAVLAAIVWFLDLGLRRLRILKRAEGVSYRFYFSVAWVIVNGLVLYGRA